MPKQISGPDALQRLDMSIADMRRMVADAISAADSVNAREAEVRDAQVSQYQELADIRMDVIAGAMDDNTLDQLHRAARDLLEKHDAYVEQTARALTAADEKLRNLEARRATLLEEHAQAIEAYEARVAGVEAQLREDAAYIALAKASEEAAAIAARAHQKLEIARADLEEKGAPYKADPLFSYLWKRRFRTPDYKAGAITRFFDNWVGRICGYDEAWMNFQRLSQLPEWLAEHAAEQDADAEEALDALEAAEQAALEKSGADDLRKAADDALHRVREADRAIQAAEGEHQALTARQADALKEEAGPANDARRLLEEGLRDAAFQDLRTLAAETIDERDDRIVDSLVKLRTEELSLELEGERLSGLPDRLRGDLASLEELRREFKKARYDSAYASFRTSAVDEALTGIVSGRIGAERAFEYITRSLRRVQPRTEPGFGGRRRTNTLGMPDVLGDVIWEIAKESTRHGGMGGTIGFPTGGGSRRRHSPRINLPKGGGGGRGGGGFKTGGGF